MEGETRARLEGVVPAATAAYSRHCRSESSGWGGRDHEQEGEEGLPAVVHFDIDFVKEGAGRTVLKTRREVVGEDKHHYHLRRRH